MKILEIIEGYITLRILKKQGFIEEDDLGFGNFLRLVFNAERNIRKGVDNNEKEQS